MKPNEILQGLVDGVTRFLQNYLRFILLTLRSPFRQVGRQYYRSVLAAEKDISVLSYLFISIFVVSLLRLRVVDFHEFDVHAVLTGIVRTANADALLPTTVGALLMTIAFDFYVFVFHRSGLIGVRRSRRLYSMTILTAAAAVFWSHIAYTEAKLLGWGILLGSRLLSSGLTHPQLIEFILAHFTELLGQLAAFVVLYIFFLPIASYIVRSVHRKKHRFPRAMLVLFPAYIGLVLSSFRAVRLLAASALTGGVEIVHVDCGIRHVGLPISGLLVLRNASSSERLIYLDHWSMSVETAVFMNASGVQEASRPGRSELILENNGAPDAIILKEGETRLLHYRTMLPYAHNIERTHVQADHGFECPVDIGTNYPT